MKVEKVVYTAHAKATGGRDGRAVSSDGVLDVKLTKPKQTEGTPASGTNPEQLFAAGYAACFLGAMNYVSLQQRKAPLPPDASVSSSVGLGPIPGGFGIRVDLSINVPGMDKVAAQAIVDAAHQVCPYSNATRNNIDVNLSLV